jgi:selenide,water dikinase
VYAWEGGPALVQTVDFFTPIVDDPYIYGQIAAANALSDVYAMGGRPVTALAIAGFPESGIDREDIAAIFKGGFDKLRESGAVLLGGHTVKDKEIKFGYAVTGAVDPARMLTNAGAKPGDVLILTKPLGTGVIGTAIKFNRISPQIVAEAIAAMRTLNQTAARVLASMEEIHACTDVTGFGLIGHASEMAAASQATIALVSDEVPAFDGVLELVHKNRSGGLQSNQEHFAASVEVSPSVLAERLELLYDPQTSGGLLVAVAEERARATLMALSTAGVKAWRVGQVLERAGPTLVIR